MIARVLSYNYCKEVMIRGQPIDIRFCSKTGPLLLYWQWK